VVKKLKEYPDIINALYEYKDFLSHSYDVIIAVNMHDRGYEQVVYTRPDFYSAPERGDAEVLFESTLNFLLAPEDKESAEVFSPKTVEKFYTSSAKSTRSERVRLTHRNGARWIKVKLLKSDLFPVHVFVCIKEITHDMQFWDIKDLLKVIGNKYSSILSVNLTMDECHLVSDNGIEDAHAKRVTGESSYTKFIEELSNSASSAFRNEIRSKLSQTFLLSKKGGTVNEITYTDEGGEHWYSLKFEFVRSMLTDSVGGLLFISCIDEKIKNKRELAGLFDQLFTIGHRLFIMYVTVDLDNDYYLINRFDGDKRYNALLEGSYSQNINGLFKYVPEPTRRRIIAENSLEKLKDRVLSGDMQDRLYSYEYLDKSGEKREVELVFGLSAEAEKAGAFIAVRDVTDQNRLKKVEEKEKELINLLGSNFDVAFTIDQNTWRVSYIKKPATSRTPFIDNDPYLETLDRLGDSYIAEEDQAYVLTMARPESILREVKRNGIFRLTHKFRKNEKIFWTEWTITPLPSDPTLLLAKCRNVTEEYVAEINRIHREEELRALKLKNNELAVSAKTDMDSGFGNALAFAQYKKNYKKDSPKTVLYLIIKDWYRYYAEGSFKSLANGVKSNLSCMEYFRLGGGELLLVAATDKIDLSSLERFAKEKGFNFACGISTCTNDFDKAVSDAYEDALNKLKRDTL